MTISVAPWSPIQTCTSKIGSAPATVAERVTAPVAGTAGERTFAVDPSVMLQAASLRVEKVTKNKADMTTYTVWMKNFLTQKVL